MDWGGSDTMDWGGSSTMGWPGRTAGHAFLLAKSDSTGRTGLPVVGTNT